MTKIIDLGNGYGRIDGYTSKYASLTFPLDKIHLGKLYVTGYLSRDEYVQELRQLGYEIEAAEWFVKLADVTFEEWKAAVNRAGTI